MKNDFEYYKNIKLFNEKQLIQIKMGIEQNIDVVIFANPKWHWSQMEQIRIALVNKKNKN